MLSLSTLRNRLRKNLAKNNRGQGATEYILLVAVVVGIVMLFGPKIKDKLTGSGGATDKIGSGMDNVIDKSLSN